MLGTQVRFSYRLTENLAERELNTAEFSDDLIKFFVVGGKKKEITILSMYQTGKLGYCES